MTTITLPTPRRRYEPRRSPTRTGKRYLIRTFGCQMNEHDSERVAGLFEADGMEATTALDEADVVFVNTCTIRENADNRMYGTLGHLKQLKDARPGALLVVGGCAAQKERDLVRQRAPWVDVVLGTHNLDRVLDLMDHAEEWGGITEIVEELEAMPAVPASTTTTRKIVAVVVALPVIDVMGTVRVPRAACRQQCRRQGEQDGQGANERHRSSSMEWSRGRGVGVPHEVLRAPNEAAPAQQALPHRLGEHARRRG